MEQKEKKEIKIEEVLCPTCFKSHLKQVKDKAICDSCGRTYKVLGRNTVSFI